jgi:hypothetical protein
MSSTSLTILSFFAFDSNYTFSGIVVLSRHSPIYRYSLATCLWHPEMLSGVPCGPLWPGIQYQLSVQSLSAPGPKVTHGFSMRCASSEQPDNSLTDGHQRGTIEKSDGR